MTENITSITISLVLKERLRQIIYGKVLERDEQLIERVFPLFAKNL
jgi:hypothetical protein